MNLWEYEGKAVRIITKEPGVFGSVFEGLACDYTDADDNEPEIASICIDNIEFREDEIESIEVIE